jgi:hypothetical protein
MMDEKFTSFASDERRGRNRTMMVEKVNLQQHFFSTGEHR